jgi:calcineurin-like phosphoesterase family protein
MKKFITSDLHFGHSNIMKFCAGTRPYESVSAMDDQMILDWNSQVSHDDLVYILGDVAFCSAVDAAAIMRRLKGKKILIAGNHDRKNLQHDVFRSCFTEIHDYLSFRDHGVFMVMFHYPIAEFDQQHRGAIHFHGHLHGAVSGLEQYRVMDVGMDATGKIVVPLDQAIEQVLQGKIKEHH